MSYDISVLRHSYAHILAQAIHIYREDSHRGVAKTKTRGEVDLTKHKVYKQKGTGNARHGAKSSPIYVGGGVAFGPTGYKTSPMSLNQKMKDVVFLPDRSRAHDHEPEYDTVAKVIRIQRKENK